MRKSWSLSFGSVGSEGVVGVGTEEGREGSVVAMLFVVGLGDTGLVVAKVLYMRVVGKVRLDEVRKRACFIERCLSGLVMFMRSQRLQCRVRVTTEMQRCER